MIVADQSAVRRFLEELAGPSRQSPDQIETHISVVFLYPDRVYKLKKAVRLPYLDFSSADARLDFCQRELSLNRRTAPDMYRAVHTIVRRADDRLALNAEGVLVDAVVEMARFDQDQLLDSLAGRGALDNSLLDALAQGIAEFHAIAPAREAPTGSQALRSAQRANQDGFADTLLGKQPEVADLLSRCRQRIQDQTTILDNRSKAGLLRRCHGDLHLRNICLFNGVPTLFDCLEFDEELASIDVLYDLAFLLMDLWHRGQLAAANRVFNRYLDTTGDTGALGLMPLFMSLRATVRAHIAAGRADTALADSAEQEALTVEANNYTSLATALLQTNEPRVIAIGGLSGSGKSTAAAAVAPFAGSAPGARILSTDRIRKALSGVGPLEQLPPEAYAPEVSARVYETQRREALKTLAGGWTAIIDGVFLRPEERSAIEIIAGKAGAPFTGVWLEAPKDRLVERVETRRNDPSDATAEVVQMQLEGSNEVTGWTKLDATQSLDVTSSAIRNMLAQ